MNASNDDKAFENTQPETTQSISNIDDPDTSLGLDHMFTDPNSPPMEDKHVIPPITQTNSSPWIQTLWDPSPPASEHDTDDITEANIHIVSFDQSFFETDDGISLVFPKLIDWDQQGPPTFDQFENDDAIAEFFELCEDLPQDDHKSRFSIDLDIMAYFGESTPSSSHKIEKITKKDKSRSLGENWKAQLDHEKVNIKDVFEGENLSEALEDRRLDIPPLKERSALLVEMIEEINLGTPNNPKVIHFAVSLSPEEKDEFIRFFLDWQINFAWSYVDMPGLDLELVLHHLPLKPGVKPVKQKLRKMHPQVSLLVKIELKKLFDAGFIRPIDYAEWISNLVPTRKHSGAIQICTDFHDLNKACPKDDFPLPNIDIIYIWQLGMRCCHRWMVFLAIIR